MKCKVATICVMCMAMILLGAIGNAQAATATAYVGTAHGANAFQVQSGGSQLYYQPQPDTVYVWDNNNGDPPGTHATYTYNDVTYDRDGMKTFACTDVAYGQSVNTIQLQFDYYTGPDTTGYNMGGVAINFFLADGNGHYGIWSATSGAALYTDTPIDGETNWVRRTLDCTSLLDTASVAIYEHNGFVDEYGDPYTPVAWGEVKEFTIAGFYDYQRTPEGGFEAWNETLWTDITNVADSGDTTLNEYGITLNWGDTVGGMYEDGNGEIGDDANRPYGQAGRLINDYSVTVGATTYDMSFEAGVVPEPGTLALLTLGGLTALTAAWIRRRRVGK